MVRSCAAFNCNNKNGSKNSDGKDVTFHRFPLSNYYLNQKWIVATRRKDFKPTANHLICSEHFEESCYLENYVNRKQLKEDAVPTIFDFPSHLNKVTKKRKLPKQRERIEAVENMSTNARPVSSCTEDHNYSFPQSPRKLKEKFDKILERKTDKIVHYKKKLKIVSDKSKRQTQKICQLANILQELKDKNLVNDKIISLINATHSDMLLEILDRTNNRAQYSEKLKAFAITLNFYSPAAYRYVRSAFNLSLPHESTLRRWYNCIEGLPGFTAESFEIIKARIAKSTHDVYCSLMFDEMSMKKCIEWDGNEFVGFVNFGCVPTTSGIEGVECREALVVMAVAVNDHWKTPIGYFLTSGVSAWEKKTIIEMAITMLHDINVTVVSVTCDGLSTNITMAKDLGANIAVDDMRPYFPHPVTGKNVYIILDPCHIIKLIRNMFGTFKNLVDGSGRKVSWEYIEKLHCIQQKEGLRLANKLKLLHLNFGQQKMKVKLAVQVLSASVSSALQYLSSDLKLQEFEGAEGTADFCLLFDQVFDICNSKNPLAKGYKAPIRESNRIIWEPFLERAACYLTSLKDSDGKLLCRGSRKTAILGILALSESIKGLYKDLIQAKKMKYLLMYKFSQDHIEMYFSLIRGRLGWNNNPSYLQFRAAYRNLLLSNEVKEKANGNCQVQDNTSLLPWTGKQKCVSYDPVVFCNDRRYDQIDTNVEALSDHDYVILPQNLTEYTGNVVVYISGYVVKHMANKLNCNTCVHSLFSAEPVQNSDLLRRKDNGGLIMPSTGIVTVCRETEKQLRMRVVSSGNVLPKGSVVNDIMSTVVPLVMQRNLFPELKDHLLDNVFPENHVYTIVKTAVKHYIKIRCHHIANSCNSNMHKKIIRQTLTKSILFQNQ